MFSLFILHEYFFDSSVTQYLSLIILMFMTAPGWLAGSGYLMQCCPCLNENIKKKNRWKCTYIKLESLLPWRGGCCSCNFWRAISEILSFAIWQASGVPLIEQERTSWVGSSVLNWILVFVSFWILEIFSPPLPITTPTAALGTWNWNWLSRITRW